MGHTDIARVFQNLSNWKRFNVCGFEQKNLSFKENSVQHGARVFLSAAHFRQHRHLRWICASEKRFVA